MKSYYKSLVASCLALFFIEFTYGQSFQGKAYYFSKTSVDMGDFGRKGLSEGKKKQIAERLKDMFEKTFILTFNQSESTYKEDEKLEAPGGGGMFKMMMGGFTDSGLQYKNVKSKEFLQQKEFFGKQFLITDNLEKLDWKLSGETKKIGQYLCMKATATKALNETDFTSMRMKRKGHDKENTKDTEKGDDLEQEVEIPKEIEITAWYTLEIPVNQGPGEYWGLPGLILEVNADRTTILCSKIVMNPKDKTTINKPKKGKKVTKEAYNTIVKKKTKEMQEMYQGRGRSGGMRPRG
ncbi:MAG: GLPGLI family protein [Flavobacteriaceae bacterium]|nr:GLPGLI family protein [Flavobacteriaceae bacterium]